MGKTSVFVATGVLVSQIALLGLGGLILPLKTSAQIHEDTCTSPPPGMISWWTADNTGNDIISTNHGVMNGGTSFTTGKVGQAFSFDGIDDFVSVVDNLNVDFPNSFTHEITVDAWIKPTKGGVTIVDKTETDDAANFRFILGEAGQDDDTRIGFWNGRFAAFSQNSIPLNQYSHVAMTVVDVRDVDAFRAVAFYINGVRDSTHSFGFGSVNNGELRIGSDINGRFFQGDIDEVEIFDRELSVSELKSIYDAGSNGKCRPESPCQASAAPVVTVSRPPTARNSLITDSDEFTLQGQVITDAPIIAANLIVKGPSGATITRDILGSIIQPSGGVFGPATITGLLMTAIGHVVPPNEISVIVQNCRGVSSATGYVTFSPGDIEIRKVEPVQVVFDSPYLVESKRTLMKVDIVNFFTSPKTVRVDLRTSAGDFTDLVTLNAGDMTTAYIPDDNPNLFIFPSQGTDSQFCFTVIVDPARELKEFNENNNSNGRQCISVINTRPLRIDYRPIYVNGDPSRAPLCFPDGSNTPNVRDFVFGVPSSTTVDFTSDTDPGSNAFLKAIFPVADSEFSGWFTCQPFVPRQGYDPSRPNHLGVGGTWDIIHELGHYGWFTNPPADKIIGIIRDGWFRDLTDYNPGTEGLAFAAFFRDSEAVLVELDNTYGETTAHEIGHTNGFDHNYCDCDTSIPASGYWVAKRKLVNSIDYMHTFGAGTARWVSEGGFAAMRFFKEPFDPKVIGISGIIFQNGTTILEPWYRFNSTIDTPLNSTGEFAVLYFDNGGSTIGQTGFDIPHEDEYARPMNLSGFARKIPDLDGTAKIVIKRGDQVMFERIFSANPPEIMVTSPNGGENFEAGEEVEVTWLSSDQDGENLTHVVSISQDKGNTWHALAVGITGNNYTFTPTEDLNSNSTLIKVLATDGINTSEDVSDQTFIIIVPEFPGGPAIISVDCNNPTIFGIDNRNDVIQGTSGDDVIDGLGGNDIIFGNGGDDEICGGNGNDVINSGDGDERINSGAGSDVINSGAGNDQLYGLEGGDVINSGPGDDLIDGGPDSDIGNAGPGQDYCFNVEIPSNCEA